MTPENILKGGDGLLLPKFRTKQDKTTNIKCIQRMFFLSLYFFLFSVFLPNSENQRHHRGSTQRVDQRKRGHEYPDSLFQFTMGIAMQCILIFVLVPIKTEELKSSILKFHITITAINIFTFLLRRLVVFVPLLLLLSGASYLI